MNIRLVSINVWDLPLPLPRFERRTRRRRLLHQLPMLDADVILVQEAFVPGFRHELRAALPTYHVDALVASRRRPLLLRMDGAGGLMVFSRWPVGRTVFEPSRPFRFMKPDERVGRKGCLWTELATPAGGLVVGNVHLYAGNRRSDARARSRQTRQIVEQHPFEPAAPTVLAGDFNMAREVEDTGGPPTGIDIMEEAGYKEVAGARSDGIATKAPSVNRYARISPWPQTDRRLTQVFLRGPGLAPGPEPPRLCLDAEPVSDHFGLMVTLSFGPPA